MAQESITREEYRAYQKTGQLPARLSGPDRGQQVMDTPTAKRHRQAQEDSNNEHREQRSLMEWVNWNDGRIPELKLLHAIPNGGHRNLAVAGKLKAEGVRKGVPDLCWPCPRGPFHGLYIEMKTRKGRPTPEQRDWIAALNAMGYRAVVCHGFEEASHELMEYWQRGEFSPEAVQ